jgi:CxxC motif-containing protein
MKKEMICIICPLGCSLTVNYTQKAIQSVEGNQCKRSLEYAEKEIFNPERTLTTTVRVKHGHLPLVSVRTNKPLPKELLFETMNLLAKIEVEAPIRIGFKITEDLFNTGVDVIATKNVEKTFTSNKRTRRVDSLNTEKSLN